MILLIDDETETYWDHTTGRAVHGPLTGTQLDVWPLYHTTIAATLVEFPAMALHRVEHRSLIAKAMGMVHRRTLDSAGFIPPPFRSTMVNIDDRLPEKTNGLGVVVGDRAVFFPMQQLREPVVQRWQEREMRIAMGEIDGSPHAVWMDDGSRPMQMLSRWYGFSATFSGCEVFST